MRMALFDSAVEPGTKYKVLCIAFSVWKLKETASFFFFKKIKKHRAKTSRLEKKKKKKQPRIEIPYT